LIHSEVRRSKIKVAEAFTKLRHRMRHDSCMLSEWGTIANLAFYGTKCCVSRHV